MIGYSQNELFNYFILSSVQEVISIEDGVSQVTNWILGPGEMLLNAQQNVGYDVLSAEDLKRNHETLELQCRVSATLPTKPIEGNLNFPYIWL